MGIFKNVKLSPIENKTGELNYYSLFGNRSFSYNGKTYNDHYNGIDITTLGNVVALAKGKVTACRDGIKGYTELEPSGNYVTLYHGYGIYTTYCHLDNGSIAIKVGDIVDKNKVLGTTVKKTTGFSTGLHLHLGIKNNGIWDDPIEFLQGKKTISDYLEDTKQVENSCWTTYKIQKGDTLYALAKKYKTTVQVIAEKNNIKNVNLIIAGNILSVPKITLETTYELKVGDKVKIVGCGNGNSYGTSVISGGIGWERTILKIHLDKPYPYQIGSGSGTTGFYKKESIQKI